MPTTIPLGFHIWSATFTVAGSTHNNVVTHAGKNGGYITAASIETVWRNAMITGSAPISPGSIPTGWTLVETKVLANIGGVLQNSINTTPVVGSGAATPPPMNTALKVSKFTGFSGRPYQARMFWPPAVLEGNVDAAANITSGLAVIQGWFTTAYGALQTASLDPVILHDPSTGLIPTKVLQWQVKSRLGTIGRRLRR